MATRIPLPVFKKAAETVYGPRFSGRLARALGVSQQTVQHYISGRNPLPYAMAGRFVTLIDAQAEVLAEVRADMRRYYMATGPEGADDDAGGGDDV